MLIIGFTGPAGCGKDTAALALVRQLGFRQFSFASPIKDALNAIFHWDNRDWMNREWKEAMVWPFGSSPRRMAQTLGTEWARDCIDPDFWVKVLDTKLQRFNRDGQCNLVTISDVRFTNEAEWIRDSGGAVIDVTRTLDEYVEGHSSEAQMPSDLVDFILPNKGGVKELEAEAVERVKKIMRSPLDAV